MEFKNPFRRKISRSPGSGVFRPSQAISAAVQATLGDRKTERNSTFVVRAGENRAGEPSKALGLPTSVETSGTDVGCLESYMAQFSVLFGIATDSAAAFDAVTRLSPAASTTSMRLKQAKSRDRLLTDSWRKAQQLLEGPQPTPNTAKILRQIIRKLHRSASRDLSLTGNRPIGTNVYFRLPSIQYV
jgi:hypothetical protein